MQQFRRLNNILGWLMFAIATAVYLATLEPTASWWDCGEYIATAFKLQVGHPPGAPLFQIIGRFFSLFAFGDTTKVAMMVNTMTAACSGFTILFLFWTITMLGLKLVKDENNMTTGELIALLGSGIVGALAYTFTDSFWFSAVEGEVYGMSSFFTALVFWAILKWDRVWDQPHNMKWIILISYLIGLSIGVHLLNLLTIPAISLVYYYRKFNPNIKGIIVTLIVSILLLALIMYFIIPYTVELAGKYEIFAVNGLGLPFNIGTIIFFIVLIGSIFWGLRFSHHETHSKTEYITGVVLLFMLAIFSWISMLLLVVMVGAYLWYKNSSSTTAHRSVVRSTANVVILSSAMFLIGYSSFFMLIIRANANTPINENEPNDAVGLLSYLNREQYGDLPVFYGQYYSAPLDSQNPYKKGSPYYVKDKKNGKYVITGYRTDYNFDKRFCTVFPRMWNSEHADTYKQWGDIKGNQIEAYDNNGQLTSITKPNFIENIRFLFTYQLNYMYFRYFMWNFVGRQNDTQGEGGIRHGNWISGIPFIDNARIGNQSDLPDSMKNAAHNKFYMLPLILGLIGLYFHLKKDGQQTLVVFMVFLMTGIAIAVYLNMYAYQPRERDYAFAGSFYAFAIWIGFGVMAIWDALKKYNEKVIAVLVTIICLLLVPGIMAKEGWDDHNRSGKTACLDFARNYLESCAPNAVLITNGDNDTFPLWYAQEVEGIRTDVRVVNFMLASGDWYVHQLMRKVYNSDPLPFTLTYHQYDKGINDHVPFSPQFNGRAELQDVIDLIASDDPRTKFQSNGSTYSILPTRQLKLTIDTAEVVSNGYVPKDMAKHVVPVIEWDIKSSDLYKNDLMLLDFIAKNKWKRPIYFASPYSQRSTLDVDKYCHLEGVVYRFLPVKVDTNDYIEGFGGVDEKRAFPLLVEKARWGNLDKPGVVVDPESFREASMHKQHFLRLAIKLMSIGDKQRTIEVCDQVQKVFPNNKISYDTYMIQFVKLYYDAGAIEKGNQLASILLKNYGDKVSYILNLSPKFQNDYQSDVQDAGFIFSNVKQLADTYKQTATAQQASQLLKKLGQ